MARQSNAGVGVAIRSARLAAGLSPEGLAFKAGVSLATVSRIENDATTPRRSTVKVIADVLGVDAAVLSEPTEEAA